jgi:exopolyphosphatase / guanosine-5'-triphosphate,3'-diphosphate pyrophosphatase
MKKEMTRHAVIDLGTNTFTILIAESTDNQEFKQLYREGFYIKLAEGGIAHISDAPYQRALTALQNFKDLIDKFQVTTVRALGTAALRTATNGQNLVADIFAQTGIEVEVIDGDREAELIFEGVRAAYPFGKQYDVIMDIGGGSVEFIIANEKGKVWAQSFPVGVAVLKRLFHHEDPISANEIEILESYLTTTLAPLTEAIRQTPIDKLIGASGTFDVLERIYTQQKVSDAASTMQASDALAFCESIVPLSSEERYEHYDIPDQRVEMIVVAMLLIRFVIQKYNITTIGISNYAMKEGLMSLLTRSSLSKSETILPD